MKSRIALIVSFGVLLGSSGLISCGGGGGNNDEVASIEILAPSGDLVPRATQQLTAVAKNSRGQTLNNVSFTWSSSNDRFLSIEPDTTILKNQQLAPTVLARGLYPGSVNILVSAGAISASLQKLVIVPINNGQVVQLTNNGAGIEDNWGNNNNWMTTSRDRILWVENDMNTGEMAVRLADIDNNQTPLQSGMDDLDFLGLGSDGFLTNGIVATWRKGLSNTFVDDGSASPDDLGALVQEENAVADGCLYFREGLPNDDIWRFSFADGLDEIFTAGQSKGPVLTSECQAAWLQEDGANSDLLFYDGSTVVTVGDDLSNTASFSMRGGRVVFSKGNDVFFYDSTVPNPQVVNLTNSPGDLENFVKTDGESILIYRIANGVTNQIVLFDIASGSEQIISNTGAPKNGDSLQIDLKQALWTEGSSLFFFDGETTAPIPLPSPLSLGGYDPYVADGTVAWVGNDGDDEIYIMK